jgi:hypothetical protein
LRKRKSTPKRLPPEAYRLPDWVLFGPPTMERSGGSVDYEERIRRYNQASDAYQRDLFLVKAARATFAALTPVPRGRQANPIREVVMAEAERRRAAGEPSSAKDLLAWAVDKDGKNSNLSIRTISLWISTKRQK